MEGLTPADRTTEMTRFIKKFALIDGAIVTIGILAYVADSVFGHAVARPVWMLCVVAMIALMVWFFLRVRALNSGAGR